MGIRINTNLDALNAQRNLGLTGASFATAVSRLSSGLRVTKAADDAAGLSISEKLRAQVRGLGQAVRNAQDGISFIQTAEGALNESSALLQRMRELSVQAANGTLSDTDANAIRLEITQLRDELNRIGTATEFNGKVLLSGTAGVTVDATSTLRVDVAADAGTTMTYTDVNVKGAGASSYYTLSGAGGTVTMTGYVSGVSATQGIIARATVGTGTAADSQTFNFTSFGISFTLSTTVVKTATVVSTDINGDFALTTSNAPVAFQIGANSGQTLGITIKSAQAVDLGTTVGTFTNLNVLVNTLTSGSTMKSLADEMITMVDDAVNDINGIRSDLGANQNRLAHTINNLNVSAENLQASESRIRDADIAFETVGFIRAQILQQAGTAVLAQANQTPQTVLALLR